MGVRSGQSHTHRVAAAAVLGLWLSKSEPAEGLPVVTAAAGNLFPPSRQQTARGVARVISNWKRWCADMISLFFLLFSFLEIG